jgi:Co/Zn/Cd efflux system component
MICEPPDDFEFGYWRLRLLPVIVMAAVMTLLSASIAFRWFRYRGTGDYDDC